MTLKKCLFSVFILATACSTVYAAPKNVNIQQNAVAVAPAPDYTYKVTVEELRCLRSKAKLFGENVKVDLIIDGVKKAYSLDSTVRRNGVWDIHKSYNFLDSLKLRVWDMNFLSSEAISDTLLTAEDMDKNYIIPIKTPNTEYELLVRVEKGDTYRNAILKLNQEMEDVILVKDEKIKDLESRVTELKYENRDLRDRLYKLTKDKK